MALEPFNLEELIKLKEFKCPHDYGDNCQDCPAHICVRIVGIAQLPSRFGTFQIVAFVNNKDGKEHSAVVHGDIRKEPVLCRLHSECLTGDALGSLRCDCRDQLEAALKKIGKSEAGVLLYLKQEGRGIGLTNKIRAYALQDFGFDTFEANIKLGFRDDERDFEIAAKMLEALQISKVKLMTNNPAKIEQLEEYGIKVIERVPLIIPPTSYSLDYLQAKKIKGGHLLSDKISSEDQ
ncbi:MAG: GTP cyclohydrolase II [Candidatus Odinarchaeota archaeon]